MQAGWVGQDRCGGCPVGSVGLPGARMCLAAGEEGWWGGGAGLEMEWE